MVTRGSSAGWPSISRSLYRADVADADEPATLLQQERDLYKRLLELGHHEDAEPFLAEAIALIARVSSAKRAYIELFEEREGPGAESL